MSCENFTFASANDSVEFFESLGGYKNPANVAPLKGDSAHEVAVGPVHAGVIEPGHFRFQCMGEDVYNLQIFLGYQHRGVEDEIVKAFPNINRQVALAETCAGDTSIAAATAYSEIIEAIGLASKPSKKDLLMRSLLLELERIANHIGDLGALAGDVAFLPTSSFCGRIRGDYLNLTALLCGNRFGRNTVVPGGLRIMVDDDKLSTLKNRISILKPELDHALKLMFEEPTVLERFQNTGVVPKDIAANLGLVGVARRACDELDGDVLSRAKVRFIEINEAHEKIANIISSLQNESEVSTSVDENTSSLGGEFNVVVSTTLAWRGPLVHAAIFNKEKKMIAYKIVDPSAHNWQGLAWALRGEQISNFPICNKSFNLSYCGTDR